MMLKIILPGPPMAKSRPRFGQGHAYTANRTRAYETALAWEGKRAMVGRKPLSGALEVKVIAYVAYPKTRMAYKEHPIGRPDGDNYMKAAFDALNGICWRDDAQIICGTIIKQYSAEPRLEIEIEEIA